MKQGGRPTDYKPEYDHMAYVACVEGGFTDVKLAKLFSVAKSTINLWKKEHPSFSDSVKKGKEDFDVATAENSLFKRVNGYRFTESTKEMVPNPKYKADPENEPQFILETTKKVSKFIPPDTPAIRFFLTNRAKKKWQNIKAVELSGPDGGSIPVEAKVEARKELLAEVDGATTGLPSKN